MPVQNMGLSQLVQSIFIVLIFLSTFGCQTKPEGLSAKQKKKLISSVEQFNTAFAHNDLSTLASMIPENYIHTNGTSEAIDRETWFQYLKKRGREIEAGSLVINDYAMSQLKVEYHNGAAIVTGKVNSSYTKEGVKRENEFRVTHLWIYENGAWKRAGFHDGKIK